MPKLSATSISFLGINANADAVAGALLNVYEAGTTTRATLYSDAQLSSALPNPVQANAAGRFPPVYVATGGYKVDITDPNGASLPGYPEDNIGVGVDVRKLDTVSGLLADTTLTYTTGEIGSVASGDIVEAGGFRYEVAASGAGDAHVTTAGGVGLYVLPGAGGVYHADALGVAKDGSDVCADLSTLIAYASNSGAATVLLKNGEFGIGANDLTLPDNISLRGANASISGSGSVQVQGSAAGASSDLSADAVRSERTITVTSGGSFNAGDKVVIAASPDDGENSAKGTPAEINEVLAVATNTLTLKYPLAHDYTTGFATEPSATVVDDLRENVGVYDLTLKCGFSAQYTQGLRVENVEMKEGHFLTADKAHRDAEINVVVSDEPGAPSGTYMFYLEGATNFRARVYTYGGAKDSVRLYGCADGSVSPTVIECANRDLWLYKCDNVQVEKPSLIGTQALVNTNVEICLLDYSRFCTIWDLFYSESGKYGAAGPECVEFRGDCEHCYLVGGCIEQYTTTAVNIKSRAMGCGVRGTLVRVMPNSAQTSRYFANFNATVANPGSGFVIDGVNVVDKSNGDIDSYTMLRSGSAEELTADYEYLIVRNCTLDRVGGGLISLNGSGSGSKIKQVLVHDNLIKGKQNNNGSIAMFGNMVLGKVYIHDCREEGDVQRNISVGSAVDEFFAHDNDVGEYTVNAAVSRQKINGMIIAEGSGAPSSPSVTNPWHPGNLLEWTDTNGGTESGVYILLADETWTKLS